MCPCEEEMLSTSLCPSAAHERDFFRTNGANPDPVTRIRGCREIYTFPCTSIQPPLPPSIIHPSYIWPSLFIGICVRFKNSRIIRSDRRGYRNSLRGMRDCEKEKLYIKEGKRRLSIKTFFLK